MPQLRRNKITGECVIIAPHRSARPGGAQPGGFEVATGIPINPSSPEDDAEQLRLAV